eukprot:1159045-Pelagomonas_calceolata.AAC.5
MFVTLQGAFSWEAQMATCMSCSTMQPMAGAASAAKRWAKYKILCRGRAAQPPDKTHCLCAGHSVSRVCLPQHYPPEVMSCELCDLAWRGSSTVIHFLLNMHWSHIDQGH